MDAVYIVRPGDSNEELRYSLRSLINLPVENVHIVGYKPTWVTGVNYLRTAQAEDCEVGTKHRNARMNLVAAMRSGDIAEEFVLMNDDFFVMKPQSELPNFHRGTWKEALTELPPGFSNRPYWQGFRATVTLLQDLGYSEPLCYSLHVPIVVKKEFYKEALRLTSPPFWDAPLAPHIRTVYGNLAQLGGTKIEDVKWYSHDTLDAQFKELDFASSMDNSFFSSPKGQYIHTKFSTPSRFEVPEWP